MVDDVLSANGWGKTLPKGQSSNENVQNKRR